MIGAWHPLEDHSIWIISPHTSSQTCTKPEILPKTCFPMHMEALIVQPSFCTFLYTSKVVPQRARSRLTLMIFGLISMMFRIPLCRPLLFRLSMRVGSQRAGKHLTTYHLDLIAFLATSVLPTWKSMLMCHQDQLLQRAK